jgi:hypothetical protein
LRLRQENAKRKAEDAIVEERPAKKQKGASQKPPSPELPNVFELGKQMAALYCPFGSRRLIFGVLQELMGEEKGDEGDKEEDSDEDISKDAFEKQLDRPEAASSKKTTPEGEYDFFEPSDQSAYIEDTARMFWKEVPPEDLEGWRTRAFQSRVCLFSSGFMQPTQHLYSSCKA